MKKFTLLSLLAVLLFSACNDSDSSAYDPYASVRPGITIYNSAVAQQNVATDPASVAVKLAMLLDEATLQNSTIEEVMVTYNGGSYKLYTLLFGQTTRITSDMNGTYRISYFDASAGIRDAYARQGVYLVQTQGISLAQSSEEQPWVVTLENGPVYLTQNSSYLASTYVIESGSNTLYRLSSGSYALVVEGLEAYLKGYSAYLSDWSGYFTWSTSTASDNLAFTTHREDTYTLYGSASGTTFYTLDGNTQTQISYVVPINDPVKWQPSRTSAYTLITEGEERATILNVTPALTLDYPSPSVRVVRSLDKNTILTTVIYNNITMQL